MDYNSALNLFLLKLNDENMYVRSNKILRVERWLMSNFSKLNHLSEEKWNYIANVFSDVSCWNVIKLKRETIGKKLIEERKPEEGKEVQNSLDIYDKFYFACKYCLTDHIPGLFKKVIKQLREEMDLSSEYSDNYILKELSLNYQQCNPVQNFWLNILENDNGKLKNFISIEKFKEVISVNKKENWGEGIEFFYNKLQNFLSLQNYLIDIAIDASKERMSTDLVEFCILKMNKEAREELLDRDYKEYNSQTILTLVNQFSFPAFNALLNHLDISCLDFKNYEKLIDLLSANILMNPALSEKTKDSLMQLWRLEKLKEYRETMCKGHGMAYAISNLIVNLRDDPYDKKKKSEILEILQCIDREDVKALCEPLFRLMYHLHGSGQEQYHKDVRLIKQLFSSINKSVPSSRKILRN